MSYRNLAWLLVVPAFVLLTASLTATAPPPDKDYKLVRSIVDVLAEVDRRYYRELSDDERKKLVEAMINGGLTHLDKHSQYFNEKEFDSFQTSTDGHFGGIGAYLDQDRETQTLMVVYPMIGTPAFEAGLEPGDLIQKVDDTSTKGLSIDDARSLIKGNPGTKVRLQILSEGAKEPRTVEITRAIIETHAVQGYTRKSDKIADWEYTVDPERQIALIRLSSFNSNTTKEMKDAIRQAEAAGAKAIILDMRGNPGGLLNEAVKVSNLFLPEGKIVGTKDRYQKEDWAKADAKEMIFGPADKKPLVVLIDYRSASASEIVAAALQDNNRAVVIGERSYGKGSVQQVHHLSDQKTAVKLTSKVWIRPNGQKIHRDNADTDAEVWGVKPDAGFDVKLSTDDRVQNALQLQQLNMGKTKKDLKPNPDRPKLDPNYKDKVVEKAIEHLRGKLKVIGN